MKKVMMGKTGLEVTKLALGGLFISEMGGAFEESKVTTLHALDNGINYIDTAPSYWNSETVLGNILKEWKGKKPIISTKVGSPKPFDPKSKKDIFQSVDRSMQRLGIDFIDILMVHEPERRHHFNWWDNELTRDGPVIEALAELKQKGKIGSTGLGGTTAHELAMVCDTGKFDMVLTTFNYSLLWREAQYEVLPDAKKHGMGVVAGTPLQQGTLAVRHDDAINNGAPWISRPRREQFKALYKLLDDSGMGIVEMAIRFVISCSMIDVVLAGARSVKEFDENYKVVEKGALPVDILKRLDEIHAMVPFRPTYEQFALPFGNEHKGIGLFW
jgi:aryl-alcohol dehydrogenase-like predicted oxidoreductase